MYEHPATQANLRTLRERGAEVLEPGVGALGSPGEWGVGRLPEPPELLAAIESVLDRSEAEGATPGGATPGGRHDLDGLEVLVTAGGTREPIDAVRFLGNRSSGRMGFALAGEAARRGAAVTVVAANVSLPRDPAIRYLDVETAEELLTASEAEFERADVLLMAAAVADFKPQEAQAGKIKKAQAGPELELRLVRTPDVLSALADRRRPDQLLVGFAAEHGPDAVANAREKLQRKGLDAVVVNDVSQPGIAFDAPDNEVVIVTREGEVAVPKAAKEQVAREILDAVLSQRSASAVKLAR
jgi:phosphopantothenoylcysteine decarboxylase / phosphopantothenate---cysteine ligase